MKIQIVSDHVCPWCYIGKRRLDRALAQRPGITPEISWLPFQLSPDTPREGRDRVAHYEGIFGAERARTIMAQMTDTARDEGLGFTLKPGARSPNTLSAHVLMYWAGQYPSVDQSALAERLFSAHHEHCEDIGDIAVLARIAGECGMDPGQVRARLAAGEDEEAVRGLMQQAAQAGVTGVPFFILDGRHAFSGAQPAEAIVELLDRISSGQAA
jgi:predicted DsbA family dithiol-disulfide isomerase